jgi:hypothetical protein
MLSLLLIAALAVQTPPASKPTQDTTVSKPTTTAAPRGTSQAAVSRTAFQNRMRELWTDHIVYTRSFIVSASAGLADTSEVLQRLLRNQDEIGEAIKPYYGDPAGTQLTSLLRSHIQLAGKALVAAKGNTPTHVGMNMTMTESNAYISNPMSRDTVSARKDATKNVPAPMSDTTKAAQTVRADTTAKANVQAQGQMQVGQQAQAGQVDSVQLNQAVTALKANADSIATFLSQANPRGFQRDAMRGGLQMHIDLLLKEVTAHLKKDWSGSIAAFDESQRQASQMADMLSEGIMKQFPSRFNNKTTTVSSR